MQVKNSMNTDREKFKTKSAIGHVSVGTFSNMNKISHHDLMYNETGQNLNKDKTQQT